MPDTVREQVVAAFAARMGAARLQAGVSLALFDESDTDVTKIYSKMQAVIPARIEYTAELADSDINRVSQVANDKLGELITTALSGDNTLGGLCVGVTYGGMQFGIREGGSKLLGLRVIFNITYRAFWNNPFVNGA